MGVGTIVVVGLVGRRVAGVRTGLLAAAIAAVSPLVWVNDGQMLSESMTMLTVAVAMLFAYRCWDRRDWRSAVAVRRRVRARRAASGSRCCCWRRWPRSRSPSACAQLPPRRRVELLVRRRRSPGRSSSRRGRSATRSRWSIPSRSAPAGTSRSRTRTAAARTTDRCSVGGIVACASNPSLTQRPVGAGSDAASPRARLRRRPPRPAARRRGRARRAAVGGVPADPDRRPDA